MYELNISTFENGKPEEFLAILKNFKTLIDVIGITSTRRIINYIWNMLLGGALQEFDNPASQKSGRTNPHLKFVMESLLRYFP